MAEDEIERLLREIDATNAKPASPVPASTPANDVSRREDTRSGGRLPFAVTAAVGLGAGMWFVGWVLPFTSAVSAGIGGAIAAFITALVAGPPRWFSS